MGWSDRDQHSALAEGLSWFRSLKHQYDMRAARQLCAGHPEPGGFAWRAFQKITVKVKELTNAFYYQSADSFLWAAGRGKQVLSKRQNFRPI